VAGEKTKARRIRISVDVPIELRRHLKNIANNKDMFFKDYIQDVLRREANRHKPEAQPAVSQ